MRACILAFSVLICLGIAAKNAKNSHRCLTSMVINRLDKLQNETTCTCNEFSADNQHSCKCFEIPKNNSCNLTCYQDALTKYKEGKQLTPGLTQFAGRTFPNLVKTCPTCQKPCGEMEKVNASVFWEKIKNILQEITTNN